MAAEFRVLGPLEVELRGRPVDLGGARLKTLLAALVLRANETVSSDDLIEALWGEDPPATAANAVHVQISRLRKLLGPGRVATAPRGYSLKVEPDEIDLGQFRKLLSEGRQARTEGEPDVARHRLEEALRLWRGRPLPELADNPAYAAEIARLEDERLSALEERFEADLETGHHSEVVPDLQSIAAANPLRERLMGQLMLALYRSGRQAEALEAYGVARRRLVAELGIEPSPLLQDLQQQILRQDPSLSPPRIPHRVLAEPPFRRHVTVLLAGLSLARWLDPEVAVHRFARAREAVREVLERYGAAVDEPLGDSVIGSFGLPVSHEDDPFRAIRAAWELVEALEPHQVGVRVAVDSAEVLASDERLLDDQIAGRMMHLNAAADEGEIVIGEGARRRLTSAVEIAESSVPDGWKLVGVDWAAEAIERRFDVPLVGREVEIERLRQSLGWVQANRRCHLVTVLGPAGIGKSRLARELSAGACDTTTILTGRCLAYGSTAFWPLAEMVRQAAGGTEPAALDRLLVDLEDRRPIVDQLAAALGTGEGSRGEDAFWAFRKLFTAIAQDRPLMLVFEDLHWAENRLLDFLEDLVQRSEGEPILVLCLARPELLEQRPSWGGANLDAESIRLDPLSEQSSHELIRLLESNVAERARKRIADRAEGNPLFIEQMVALAAEEPDAPADAIPPSIHAVLAARIDRLDRVERSLLEAASIVGLEFSADDLSALPPEVGRAVLAAIAQRLVRKGLLRPVGPEIRGGEKFRFRHLLIRDVVYDSILKSTRTELHERFARGLLERSEERAGELDEIAGYHLERAYALRRELDPNDEALEQLASEAGERLAVAGERAVRRSDTRAAIQLLTRAIELLPDDGASRGHALGELAYAYRLIGQWDLVRHHLAEGFSWAELHSDDALKAYLTVSELQLRLHTEPSFTVEEFIRVATKSLGSLEADGPSRHSADVRVALAWPYALLGHNQRAETLIEAACRISDDVLESRKLLPSLWLNGPLPVNAATVRCEALLAENPMPRITASCYRSLAVLNAMSGRFSEARSFNERDRSILEELGLALLAAATASLSGVIELLAGEAASAERVLRAGLEDLGRLGASMHSSALGASLARALHEQGEDDEAWSVLESVEGAPMHDVAYGVEYRGIRARLLARRGLVSEAYSFAREAVATADQTDSPDLEAGALVDLADVLRLSDRLTAARQALQRAIDLYDQKGNVVSAHEARALLNAC